MKLIIAGTRTFNDYELLKHSISQVPLKITEIVSGGAKGADFLGERYAKEYKIQLKIFNADWDTYGKSAGPKRNKQMAEYANALLVFWDMQSKGTKNMIDEAKNKNLRVFLVDIS